MNLGYIFTFILTAFSTITTILPFLTQSSENNNPDIYRFQALYTLINPRSSNTNKLSADLTLHTMLHYTNYTQVRDVRSQNASYQNNKDPEVLLSLAALNYNINHTADAENFANHAKSNCGKNPECLQKVWYFHRLSDINKPNNNNVVHEDRECIKTNWTCTQKELKDIDTNISSLSQSGYNLQFHNDKSPVDFLEKPLAAFVANLHSLIIISLIIVFIFFIAMRRGRISRLFTRTV